MSLIRARNTLPDQVPYTASTFQEVAGTNVIRWKNADGFAASWAVQIGATGIPQAEVVLLNSSTPSGTAGTLTANTRFEHPSDTPLFAIKYDQVVFERSTVGTSGTATPLANGTVTIQADSVYTIFDDTSSIAGYAYRTYFRNSALGVNSAESDWITPAGFSFYSLARLRSRVRRRFYNSDFLQDSDIDESLNEWLQVMHNAQVDVNEDYGIGTMNIAFGANTELGTVTVTDFRGGFKRVWLTDSTGTYTATKMDSNSYSPNRIFNNTFPYYYMQGDSVVGRKPFESAGTMSIEYNKQTPILVNDTDEIPVPMQSFTKSFIDYGNAMGLHRDNKHQEAIAFENVAAGQLNTFKTQIAPRNTSSNAQVEIVEGVGDDDGGVVF